MADFTTGTTPGWFPAVTALFGFIAAGTSEWLRDNRTNKRERQARDDTRQAQLFDRRAAFQRETLISLQDTVAKLVRTAGKMNHLDKSEFRKTGKWGGFPFPDGLSETNHELNVSVMLLTSRVQDKEVREMADSIRAYASRVGICPNSEAETETLNKIVEVLEPFYQRIGEVLRGIDDQEDEAIASKR